MRKGSQLSAEYFDNIYNTIDAAGQNLEDNISLVYNASNSLYNHSSTIEDILTTNLSTFTNRLNSVSFSYASDTTSFIESFESTEFVDKAFSVDKALTIDSLNKTLTLPEIKTTQNVIVSVIVEPDSNGIGGNSLSGYKNADLSVITDGDVSSIYEYERFSSTFDSSSVDLVLTLKLATYAVTNGIYIKLFSPDGVQFPIVDFIEVSSDSVKWDKVDYFLDQSSPKNDYYVRYLATGTRYVRVKLSQAVAQYVNTGFGIKQRYAIGIREIQILTTEYDTSGDYISIPFSSGSSISKVLLESDYQSNSDLNFYVSANNGGKWLQVTPSQALDLYSSDTGVLYIENLKSIRLRIGMKRSVSPILASLSQLSRFAPTSIYYLKYKPVNLTAMLGGHVSFGDIKTYTPTVQFPYNVQNELSNNSGLTFTTTGDSVTGQFSGSIQSFTTSGVNASDISINLAKEYIRENKGSIFVITLKYIPYTDNIDSMLEVSIGGQQLKQWFSPEQDVLSPTYLLIRHENRYHTYLYLDLKNLGIFQDIPSGVLVNGSVTSGIGVRYSPVSYSPSDSSITGQFITLPYKSMYPSSENFIVIAIDENKNTIMLNNKTDFALLSDKKTIKIDNSVYSNKVLYKISFLPAFEVDEFLPSDINTVTVNIPSISDADPSSSLLFEYTYQDQQSISDIKYYSPICKKYKVTLS